MPLSPSELQAATSAINQAKKLLLIPHANVDPDGLSSALALFSLLKGIGKDVTVICPDTLPETLDFLPNFGHLETSIQSDQQFVITLDCSSGVVVDKLRYTIEDQKVNIIVVPKKGTIKPKDISFLDTGSAYDLIVVLDTAEVGLLGSLYTDHIDLFTQTPILNIDHHISNTRFGQLQLIDPTAASATEVLYSWFLSEPKWKEMITADMATLLLTGLITDTRSFQNPNTTPRSLEVAANLLDLGARQQQIIQHIYKTKPLSTLKIWGRALNRIQMDPETRIVWSAISREDLQEMGATSKETAGLLDELISTIPEADVHVLFTEVEEGGFKASMRSSPAIDVNRAAGRVFGGGGHARAAGFKLKNYGNFQLAVIECIQKLKEEMKRQREETDGAPTAPAQARPVSDAVSKPIPQVPTDEKKSPKKESIDVVEKIGEKKGKKTGSTDVVGELGSGEGNKAKGQ